jgi:hypothetical protein
MYYSLNLKETAKGTLHTPCKTRSCQLLGFLSDLGAQKEGKPGIFPSVLRPLGAVQMKLRLRLVITEPWTDAMEHSTDNCDLTWQAANAAVLRPNALCIRCELI